jgi:hypothetical protein
MSNDCQYCAAKDEEIARLRKKLERQRDLIRRCARFVLNLAGEWQDLVKRDEAILQKGGLPRARFAWIKKEWQAGKVFLWQLGEILSYLYQAVKL